ncbi:MAG: phosphate regulon sensor histidine kinase PhoR [Gammaproteobacteria bacterium]|nr:MAG: phosphate regulon sensor histidine kinase PhoR [Gammaproteobacteria bacterium]RKZ97767.1 MAG: phosphate regulon sensor histidine kinase PhoR [Gammaproteobacteria bacterium]
MHWDYWRLLIIVSLAGFVGLLFGQMLPLMFLAAFAYAMWLQRSWNQLYRWLKNPKKYSPPKAEGMINDICREIKRVHKQNKSRKKKLTGYLRRFQATTAALPDGIVVLAADGRIIWSNAAAEELLGVYWPQDNHVRVKNLIRDPKFQQLFDLDLTEGQFVNVTSPLKADLQLEVKIVRYMGSGRLLVARDITHTLKLQTMRRDFVANVSHELRTPLTVLRGYLETFNENSPVEQWSAALPVMQQQTERMHVMITDLLALSQLETGEKALSYEPTDISELLSSISEDAKKLEQYRSHEIELKLSTRQGLLADADELRSAVSNLVFNAVKYTPDGSKITVSWFVDSEGAHIKICDQGEGIAEHHLERLTERFYRVDSGRSQEAGGTGLGLAIVKHVLQRHDADLKISSELGVGSQFVCNFPLMRVVEL